MFLHCYLQCSSTHAFYIRPCITPGACGFNQSCAKNQLFASCERLHDKEGGCLRELPGLWAVSICPGISGIPLYTRTSSQASKVALLSPVAFPNGFYGSPCKAIWAKNFQLQRLVISVEPLNRSSCDLCCF